MTYVSILVPAFFTKETEESEIKKLCSFQFAKAQDEFDITYIDKNELAIKFKQSDLSLSKIEELIYQRDCLKSLVEKTFESFHLVSEKLNSMERDFRSFTVVKNRVDEDKIKSMQDNQKLKEILALQFETSESFKLNTERTLNIIKEDFDQMVMEFETLRSKTTKHKSHKSMDLGNRKSVNSAQLTEPKIGDDKDKFSQTTKKNVPKLKLHK